MRQIYVYSGVGNGLEMRCWW